MSKDEEFDKAKQIFNDEEETDRIIEEETYDIELWTEFTNETKEHCEEIEKNLLDLEVEPTNKEIINALFRYFHTIKGLAGFVEINILSKLAHQTENLLDKARKEHLQITEYMIDAILVSNDYVKGICNKRNLIYDEEYKKKIKAHIELLSKIEDMKEEEEIVVEDKMLGEILIDRGILTEEELMDILELKKCNDKLKTGEIARKKHHKDAKDIIGALRTQKKIHENKEKSKENYIKISADKIETLVNYIGELMIIHSQIERDVEQEDNLNTNLSSNVNRMIKVSKYLQTISMTMQMIPLKSTFQKISRIARDTLKELNKEVHLELIGENTEIDRNIADKLLDPLIHLVKNSIGHGIEDNVVERINQNKSKIGNISIKANSRRGNVYIEIEDDGKGLDIDKIYEKAKEKNIIEENKNYSNEEIMNFIFLPGFSTNSVVNQVSGRGVGMDVVKTEISRISGKVEIQSEKNKGTKITLKIPINLAALNGTVVEMNKEKFIIPTIHIKKILKPEQKDFIYIKDKLNSIRFRENIVEIINPKIFFDTNQENKIEENMLLIIEIDNKFKALPVETVLGRQEIVVKPLGDEFSNINYLSGASILGDGKVALILDVENLINQNIT